MIRTRFAPSPTGFLHIGGARTALFSWAYARKHKDGKFFLRIEDTDLERSTQESVDSIIQAMQWINLNFDNDNQEIYYQTKHFPRYKEVINQLLASGHAYHCYCSKEDLDTMREQQKAAGQKPKYDRRCLHNNTVKPGVAPVVRFKNPETGSVVWNDLVKGRIEIQNTELDDLIIARSDGTPTYNFCVVVDDLDMQITHVVRGDDHVNNTPRQINILQALNATIPAYAHVPMILRDDGQKMSKRTDAVSVMQYKDMGILPAALLNYLARLCWGHGDDEIFTLAQFVEWFSFEHISASPARFDMQKLLWVNAQHIKQTANSELAKLVTVIWTKHNTVISAPVLDPATAVIPGLNRDPDIEYFNHVIKAHENSPIDLNSVIELFKSRSDTLNALAKECAYIYTPLPIDTADADKHLTSEAQAILDKFATQIATLSTWDMDSIKALIKEFCATQNLKMPALGMPLRLKLCGTTHTPSFDSIIHLLGKAEVLSRLSRT